MVATATAILQWNGIPVFADIEPDSFNIDPASVEKLIGPRTRAIMAVDIFGQSCNIRALRDIATLRHVQHLSQNESINLQGIRRILALENELDAVRAQLSRVADLLTTLQHEVPAARIFTAAAAGDVHLGRSAARRPALALPSRASTARDLARRDVPPVSKAL